MSDLSYKVLAEIEEKKITPKPKYEFMLKDFIFWIFLTLSILLGTIAISVLFHILANNGITFSDALYMNPITLLLTSFPFLWLFCAVVFLVFAYYYYRRTDRGYKVNGGILFIIFLSITVTVGAFWFFIGLGNEVQTVAEESLPLYSSLYPKREKLWMRADRGMLGGEITEIAGTNEFTLKDFQGNQWHVLNNDISPAGIKALQKGTRVRMVGKEIDNATFEAQVIRPWGQKYFFLQKKALRYMPDGIVEIDIKG